MKLVYEWPHFVGGLQIGVIRRFLVLDEKKGTEKKIDIPYYNKVNGNWEKGIPEEFEKTPLFGLGSFKNTSLPLIACEGQKTQKAWEWMGFQAVTLISGSKSAAYADWKSISGAKRIWLAPDNDEPGERLAEEIWRETYGSFYDEIQIIRLPGLPNKGDLVDWIQAQPEFKNWNGYDPIDEHPAREIVKERLDRTISQHIYNLPSTWTLNNDWAEPAPLDTSLRRVRRLPEELIPAAFRPWILDTQKRMGAPLEYLAISAIVSAGTAIGASCAIRPKKEDTWEIVPILWGLICGPVSFRKTPCLKAGMQGLQILDNKAFADYEKLKEEYKKQEFVFEQNLSAIRERGRNAARGKTTYRNTGVESTADIAENLPDSPEPPKLKRFTVNDATVPALTKILAENDRGVVVFQDELYQLLKTWDQEGRQTDRPFFLQAWNGNQPWTTDRVSTEHQRIKNLAVSILGGMQPDTMRRYLIESGEDQNDGIIQRFQMLAYLDKQDIPKIPDDVDRKEDFDAKLRARMIYEQLSTMSWLDYGAQQPEDPEAKIYYKFSPEAQQIFFEWNYSRKEKMELEENPLIEQHLGKYDVLFARLALIFHLIEIAVNRRPGLVTKEAAQLAADWCAFLEYHMRRIYEISKPKSMTRTLMLADRIQKGKLKDRFTAWMIEKKGWRGLKSKEDIMSACKQLVELNWLKMVQEQNKKGGPPKVEFLVNPKIGIQC